MILQKCNTVKQYCPYYNSRWVSFSVKREGMWEKLIRNDEKNKNKREGEIETANEIKWNMVFIQEAFIYVSALAWTLLLLAFSFLWVCMGCVCIALQCLDVTVFSLDNMSLIESVSAFCTFWNWPTNVCAPWPSCYVSKLGNAVCCDLLPSS